MNCFGSLCLTFQNISRGPRPNLLHFVSLLLSFPCFEISHLFFKVTYFLPKHGALLLRRKCCIVCVDCFRLDFDETLSGVGSLLAAYHRLTNLLGSLERRQCSGNRTHIRHDPPPI